MLRRLRRYTPEERAASQRVAAALPRPWHIVATISSRSDAYAARQVRLGAINTLLSIGLLWWAHLIDPIISPADFNTWLFVAVATFLLRNLSYLPIYFRMFPADKYVRHLMFIPLVSSLISCAFWSWTTWLFFVDLSHPTSIVTVIVLFNVTLTLINMSPLSLITIVYLPVSWSVFIIKIASLHTFESSFLFTIAAALLVMGGCVLYMTFLVFNDVLKTGDAVDSLVLQLRDSNSTLSRMRAETADELEQRSTFFTEAAHDFGNRLRLLQLLTDGATRSMAVPNPRLYEMGKAIDDLSVYVSTVLEFARLESGVITPSISRISLQPLFLSLKTQLAPLEKAYDIHIRVRPTRAAVLSDDSLVRRILENIVANAARYTRGSVLIAARQRADAVFVDIYDQGLGIPEDIQPRIFDVFYRHEGNHKPHSGHGLGLAIVKRLVTMLHLKIEVRSRVNRGTMFRVIFPIANPAD